MHISILLSRPPIPAKIRLTGGRALRFFGLALGFVEDHLQISLVAQATFGGLDAGFGDVFRIEADGGAGQRLGLRERDAAFSREARHSATAQASLFCGFVEFIRELLAVVVPSLGFFGFGCERRDFQIRHAILLSFSGRAVCRGTRRRRQ